MTDDRAFYAEMVLDTASLSPARLKRFLKTASRNLGEKITSARIDLIAEGSEFQTFRLHAETSPPNPIYRGVG